MPEEAKLPECFAYINRLKREFEHITDQVLCSKDCPLFRFTREAPKVPKRDILRHCKYLKEK